MQKNLSPIFYQVDKCSSTEQKWVMGDIVERDTLVHKATLDHYIREKNSFNLVLLGTVSYRITICIVSNKET